MVGQPFIDTVSGDFKYQGTTGAPAVLAQANGNVHLIPLVLPYTGSTGFQSVGTNVFTGIGTLVFNPIDSFSTNSKIVQTLKFQTILECTPGVTAEIQIYNVNLDGIAGNSLLSTNSSSPLILETTFEVGNSFNVPNTSQIYEIQLRISDPSPPDVTDRAICKLAQIVITWS